MKPLFAFRLVSLLVCSALLAACGGGGGGGGRSPPPPATTFTLGGTLTGLATGASVVLQFNGGSNTTVSANGSYSFAAAIPSGTAYTVTVLTQPSGQTCTVANGSGTVTANVTNVAVTCASTAGTVTIGGTASGLAASTSVVLQNNGGSNLTVSANGPFTFGTAISSGNAYAVTVLTQPTGQTCAVASGSGTASANVTNVAVTCSNTAPTSLTLGGTVSGLAASTNVVLQWNGGSNLTVSANGPFTFTNPIPSGTPYTVAVATQPSAQTCAVTNAGGTISANVTNVGVSCTANQFAVSGTVTGLIGSIVLRNNGNSANDLTISTDGTFTFGAQLPGSAYAVTLVSHPTGPAQNCTVNNGSGTIGSTATNISVACVSVDQTPPTITGRAPMPSAVGSKIKGDVIFAAFSEALDPSSVTVSSVKMTGPLGAVSGEVTLLNGNKDVHFTPGSVAVPAPLAYDTTYTVTLTTAIRDPSHNQLTADTVWTFNTGKKVAMGFYHTCARLDDGGVKCWGRNDYGQLGYDDKVDRGGTTVHMDQIQPVNLGANHTAVALVAGDYSTCARLDDSSTKCWGSNEYGQLGQHTDVTNQSVGDDPGEMAALPAIDFGGNRFALELAAGEEFACARLDNDTVKCWGLNTSGQLGQGSIQPLGVNAGDLAAASPIDLGTGLTPRGLALGHYHACALLQDSGGANHVKCWGDNRWGQLGRGTHGAGKNIGDNTNPDMGAALTDVDFGAGRTAKQVYANGGHSCALLDNASVKCWGLNTWGQVGLNANMVAQVDQITCDPNSNTCIGDEPNEMGDTLTAAVTGVARLTVGTRHNCVLLAAAGGQVKCWGSNEHGQLGIGNKVSSNLLIGDAVGEIANLAATPLKAPTVEEVTAGGFSTCVWNTDKTLNCWGWNYAGQLGHNTNNTDINDDSTDWGDGPNEMGASLPDTPLGT